MSRKRCSEDDILRLIREVEVQCNSNLDVVSPSVKLAYQARPTISGAGATME